MFNAPVVDAVFEAGKAAGRVGLPIDACPFPYEQTTFMSLRDRWMLGHKAGAFVAPVMTTCCGD